MATVPSDHAVALANQARAIRLAAQRLEREARTPAINSESLEGVNIKEIQRQLRTILHNLHALQARFGE